MCIYNEQGVTKVDREILPQNVTPTHYNLTIVPGLETFTFTGQVAVSLTVNEATKTIVANALEVNVSKASIVVFRVKPGGLDKVSHWPKDATTHRSIQNSSNISYDKELQTVTFEFEHEIPAVSKIILHIEFDGIHNDQMAGFYRSGYTDKNGNKKHLVVTQFEATDCRRCFPCWDEPALKATFDVTLYVPEDKTALSNMHVMEESPVSFNEHKLKCVKFAKTPIMSTYLLALCVGEFDYVESVATPRAPADARPIKCRVYTLPGQKHMGTFGLDVSVKTLEYFSEYFDVAYPLPKMDMVAIPDFGAGAMENWGLVTYRETALLFDSENSSAKAKEGVAYTVAHELAHQWFGNLVTMSWWNELWLNEGFATSIGWQAVDHIFPEWNVFTSFLNGEFASGVGLDSMRSSHPIEVDVKSPSEISQIFDAISYSKGASVIRMLNDYLGMDVFANGVRKYLQKHKFGNAKTVDLWAALSESSGKDVAELMHEWTRAVGYPMLSIQGEEYDGSNKELTVSLSQQRFLSTGDLTPEEDVTVWSIPIAVLTNESKTSTTHLLKEKNGSITFPYQKTEEAYYKLNAGVSGFFRVNYSVEQITRLGHALRKNINAFSTADRIGLIADSFAFARAGLASTTAALEILKAFESEQNEMVLSEIHSRFGALKKTWFKNQVAIEGLHALQRSIFSSKVDALGYEYPKGEDHVVVMKRNLVIAAAAEAGDER
jgi:aminopeptidase 2